MRSPADLATFFERTGVPVALDETLDENLHRGAAALEDAVGKLLGAGGLAAVVAKPSALGGPEATMQLVHWARRHGVQVNTNSLYLKDCHRSTVKSCIWCRL